MRGLHTDSQNSGQGKALIGVNVMKENFSRFLDSLLDMNFHSQDMITELQALSGCIHVAKEELPNQLNVVKELDREHSKWLLRYTNIHVPRHEELILIIVVAEVYRAKAKKRKKSK